MSKETDRVVVDTRGIAIVLPLEGEDHGFAWGTDREHVLLRVPIDPDDVASLTGWPRGGDGEPLELDGVDWEDVDEIVATIRECLDLHQDDVRVVDIGEGVTDDWPSAGCGDSWPDDVWLGVADYLSFRAFGGGENEYTLDAADADAAVANNESHIVSDAADVIERRHGDADPVAVVLRAAIRRQSSETPRPGPGQ